MQVTGSIEQQDMTVYAARSDGNHHKAVPTLCHQSIYFAKLVCGRLFIAGSLAALSRTVLVARACVLYMRSDLLAVRRLLMSFFVLAINVVLFVALFQL